MSKTNKSSLFNDIWNNANQKGLINLNYTKKNNLRVDKTLSMIGQGEVILDIGGGNGILGTQLKEKFSIIVTTDISMSPLITAKKNDQYAIFHNFDKDCLPFMDNSVDVICLLTVIQYLGDPSVVVNELQRILKSSGSIFLSAPNMRAIWRIFKIAFNGEFPKTCFDPFGWDGGAIHYFCSKDIEILLRNNGFKIINKVGVKYIPSFFEVFEKIPIINNFIKEFFSAEFLIEAKKI